VNFLDSIGKQIRELFATMTPSARIMAALMAGVVIVSLGWIVSTQQSSQTEYLFGGQSFSEDELNLMERAWGEAGLRSYERIGKRLKIPTAEKDLYIKALGSGNAVPLAGQSALADALNVGSSPFIPPSIVAEKVKHARQEDLAQILKGLPGIDDARVSYDLKEARFGRDAHQGAVIFLRGSANRPVSMSMMRQIADLATNHFPGLKPENVTVMDWGGGESYRGSSDPLDVEQQPYLRAQRDWEEFYERKIREELSVYGDVKLGVIVELDPTLKRETEELKYDPTGTATQATNSRKDTKNAKAGNGGRPGAEPNAAFANKSASVSGAAEQVSESKESQESLSSVIGHSATVTKEAPLTPKRVSVTVGVPESFYRKVAAQRFLSDNPDKSVKDAPAPDLAKLQKETEDNIRAALEGQLPQVRQGDDRFQLVKVYSYTDLPTPIPPDPTLLQTTLNWLSQSWSTLAMFMLVGVGMLMMFSWVRAQPSSVSDRDFAQGFGLEVPASMGDSLDLGDNAPVAEAPKENKPKFEVTGGEIKEELSSLVKQNPDAAVNLLRTWIADAA